MKKKRDKPEEKKLLSFSNTIKKPKVIRKHMKYWWMNLSKLKQLDNGKWKMLNGKENSKQESTFSRMSTIQENMIFFWSKQIRKNQIGSKIMKDNKLKRLSLNKMLNLKLELLEKLLIERLIKWIYWSKWTKKTEFREHISKKKCMKREQRNLLS